MLVFTSSNIFAQVDSVIVETLADSLVSVLPIADTIAGSGIAKSGSFAYAPSGDIESTINYHAKDSIWFNVKRSTIFLYGDAHVDYGDIVMDAAIMEIDYSKNLVCSYALQDSAGNYSGIPYFKDGENEVQALEMCYNYSTKRAKISKIYLEQDEWKTQGDTVLMDEFNNIYIKDGTFCPCDDIDNGTYIKAKRIKIIPGKKVVTGPFNLYIADVPTPLGFFFGYFPIPKEKSSGIIIPQFGEQDARGFYLRDGGYYWAMNDYVGAAFTGEAYTNGGYGVGVDVDYKKRYRHSGNLSFKFRNVEYDADEYDRESTKDYELRWSHKPKSRGGKRFTSDVNIATTTFNSNNSYNTEDYLQSSMKSYISYSAPIKKTPFRYSLNFRHDQNNQDGAYNFSLPNGNVSMSRLYVFKPLIKGKKSAINEFVKSIGLSYKFDFDNKLTNKYSAPSYSYPVSYNDEIVIPQDTVFKINQEVIEEMWRTKKIGMKHTIPVSGTFKIGQALNVNPSMTYTENWYLQQNEYNVDTINGEKAIGVDTLTQFSRVGNMSTSVNVSSRMYGYYGIKGTKSIIRHTLVPTIGFRYNPDYSQDTDRMQELAYAGGEPVLDGNDEPVYLSKYQDAIYKPGTGVQQSAMTFRVTNAIQLKHQTSDSTDKKISILDNIGASSSYNFAADSFQLAPFNLNANTNIFGYVNFQSGMTVDPYTYEARGEDGAIERVNKYSWNEGKGLGVIQRANFSLGTSLNPAKLKGKGNPSEDVGFSNQNGEDFGKDTTEEVKQDYRQLSQNQYVDFSMPWNFRIRYAYNYRYTATTDEKTATQSLQFGGDFKVTDKWRLGYSASYDIEVKAFVIPSLNIYRDLNCWEMRIDWIPFGPRTSYGFYINIKSNALKELKISKKNTYYDQ